MRLPIRSEEHTSELQSHDNLVCRLLLEKKNSTDSRPPHAPSTTPPPPHCHRPHHPTTPAEAAPPRPGVPRSARALTRPCFFFFIDPGPTGISTLSLRAPLPI